MHVLRMYPRLAQTAASPHGLAPETHQRAGRRQQIAERYGWDDVAARYRQMCERLAAGADWRASCEARPDAGTALIRRRSRCPTNADPCRCCQRSNLSSN